eukprot:Lithocolla_globosa_v1_NODE_1137_length_2843_cov_20.852941.p3 type:complete len:140 gc:universal NODE_1137_length_2843_cov_20.852941:1836-2255(+)
MGTCLYRRLRTLPPSVRLEFELRNGVIRKTMSKFSAIAIDHAHEQTNDDTKDDGGVIGITQNPDALRRFLLTGPDLSRIVSELSKILWLKTNLLHCLTRSIMKAARLRSADFIDKFIRWWIPLLRWGTLFYVGFQNWSE